MSLQDGVLVKELIVTNLVRQKFQNDLHFRSSHEELEEIKKKLSEKKCNSPFLIEGRNQSTQFSLFLEYKN